MSTDFRLRRVTRAARHPVAFVRLKLALRAGLPIMLDDVDPNNIPLGTPIVAGYVDGLYKWSAAGWARFSNSQQVPITVFGLANVRSCDCETGDLTPDGAAYWAHAEVVAGRRPTIYCNTSTVQAVINALAQFGLLFMRDVDWWQAQYDGRATLVSYYGITPVAKQYLDPGGGSPGPYDVSITNGVWPATTAPTPIPTLLGDTDMDIVAIAPRPTSITAAATDDVFFIDADGHLNFQANSPYWVAGNAIQPTPQPYAALQVGASWASDASALRVFVLALNPDLKTADLYVNAMLPGVWQLGGWVKLVSGLPLPK